MNKRILLIGISFNDAYGAGVTLRNLFSAIPPENIGVVDYCVTFEDFNYAKSLFRLGKHEKPLVQCDLDDKESINKKPESLQYKRRPLKFNFARLFWLSLRKYLAYYYNNYLKVPISNKLKGFIDDFKPDFIYVVPYNRRIIHFALRISSLKNVPIITHFMDDFRNRSPLDLFYPINEHITKLSVKTIAQKSYRCLAICESMAREYEIIFDKKFDNFHNPINIDSFRTSLNQIKGNDKILKIIYTGTIAENNFDTLLLFSKICEQIGKENQSIIFDIYAPEMRNNIFYKKLYKNTCNYEFVNINKSIDHERIIPLMYEYDMLLLPLTFNKKYYNAIRVSFPTKVAEYMASGIPTLYIIPKDIALHKFVQSQNIGYLIDENIPIAIKIYMVNAIKSKLALKMDNKAKEIAYNNFDINKVSSKFKSVFN